MLKLLVASKDSVLSSSYEMTVHSACCQYYQPESWKMMEIALFAMLQELVHGISLVPKFLSHMENLAA